MRIITCFALMCLWFNNSLVAQEQTSVTKLLNRNEISIYKAQKELIAHNTKVNLDKLALSVTLQVKAVDAYKRNNLKDASIYALASRENALIILKSLIDVKQLNYFELDNEENDVMKSVNYQPSSSLNTTEPYNEAVLLDPIKLKEIYSITINQ